jgi:hypothetical protein
VGLNFESSPEGWVNLVNGFLRRRRVN